MQRGQVELRECKQGDILVSAHGAILVYEGIAADAKYYPHVVRYISHPSILEEGLLGSRTHDGYSWKEEWRTDEDHDIVLIIPKELLQSEGILGVTK